MVAKLGGFRYTCIKRSGKEELVMSEWTLGQRIARERKKLGISQVGLATRLDVSRQAISKWESDAAIPEIDKLIALSRLFGVSVGWLLGVEELPEPPEDQNSRSGISEEQLLILEELIRKYQQPPTHHLTVKHYVLAFGCSLLIFLLLYGITSRIERNMVDVTKYNTLAARVAILEEKLNLGSQLDGVLVTDYLFNYEKDAGENQARLYFQGVPLQWEDGDSAEVAVRWHDQEVYRCQCSWDGQYLRADVRVDLEDGYEYALFVHRAGGIQQHQMLYDEDVQNLRSLLEIRLEAEPGRFHYSNNVLTLTDYSVRAIQPDILFSTHLWTRLDFVLYRNGEEVGRDTLLDAVINVSESITTNREVIIHGHLVQFRSLSLREGDLLELKLEAALESGDQAERLVQTFSVNGEEGLTASNSSMSP